MALNKKEILDLLNKMNESSLLKDDSFKNQEDPQSIEEIKEALLDLDMPTDDEVLYWSCPYYDEIKARKEELQKLKEEER